MGNTVTSVTVDSWIYLDSFDQVFTNQAPAPGSIGYETLLHEIGHALGLKHPFDSPNILSPGLAFGQDNAGTSIMSYTSDGTIHRTFSPYDLAALDWLYGRDGLGGNYGVGSPGKYIEGGVASESFSGGAGDDFLAGNGGNDAINGGAGTDTAMYTGNRNQYAITKAGGAVTVVDKFATEGTDALTSIERLQFSDMSVNLQVGDISRALGTPLTNALVELYTAYLNRTPDADGMAYWMNQLLAGQSLGSIGDGFYSSAVYFGNLTGYSVNTTNADFVTTVYKNVLGRSSVDAQGLAYWTNELATGHQTRANLVSSILGSAHTFKGDATYGWVADLLDNKIAVGKAVAIDAGLVYNTSEASITKGMAIEAAVTPTSTAAAISLVGVTDPLHLLG
jgi:hypothetical protein